jgi:hypothetical protein
VTQIDGKNENKSQFHFIFSRLFLFQFFSVEIANQREYLLLLGMSTWSWVGQWICWEYWGTMDRVPGSPKLQKYDVPFILKKSARPQNMSGIGVAIRRQFSTEPQLNMHGAWSNFSDHELQTFQKYFDRYSIR